MKKNSRLLLAAMIGSALALGAMQGCAVKRDQSTVGEYVDDAAITTQIKSKFVESKSVDASSITVETLKGTVQLSGFAKSSAEKYSAESIAKSVKGVVSVRNDILVRQ